MIRVPGQPELEGQILTTVDQVATKLHAYRMKPLRKKVKSLVLCEVHPSAWDDAHFETLVRARRSCPRILQDFGDASLTLLRALRHNKCATDPDTCYPPATRPPATCSQRHSASRRDKHCGTTTTSKRPQSHEAQRNAVFSRNAAACSGSSTRFPVRRCK